MNYLFNIIQMKDDLFQNKNDIKNTEILNVLILKTKINFSEFHNSTSLHSFYLFFYVCVCYFNSSSVLNGG